MFFSIHHDFCALDFVQLQLVKYPDYGVDGADGSTSLLPTIEPMIISVTPPIRTWLDLPSGAVVSLGAPQARLYQLSCTAQA